MNKDNLTSEETIEIMEAANFKHEGDFIFTNTEFKESVLYVSSGYSINHVIGFIEDYYYNKGHENGRKQKTSEIKKVLGLG
jgi:hypothetical protein